MRCRQAEEDRRGVPAKQCVTRSLAAVEKALLPQLAEGAGDGGPADVQGRRQLALAGQARLQRQATIKDQQAERFRQLAP